MGSTGGFATAGIIHSAAVDEGRRRVARLVPAQTPQWVLLLVMREVRTPAWAPEPVAQRLLAKVRSPDTVRLARVLLRRASRERVTLSQVRALATLDLAIGHLDEDDA